MNIRTITGVTPQEGPASKETIASFMKEFKAFFDADLSPSITHADRLDAYNSMEEILLCKETPACFFSQLAFGSFKECFTIFGSYVLKFCSFENATEDEITIMQKAQDFGVGDVFIKSKHIPLPVALPVYFLDGYDLPPNETYTSEPPKENCDELYFTDLIIQPLGYTSSTRTWAPVERNESRYLDNPIRALSGERVAYDTIHNLGVKDRTWLQNVINYYGLNFFYTLYKFILKLGIDDLHEENTGYIIDEEGREKPIIIDWLSPPLKN